MRVNQGGAAGPTSTAKSCVTLGLSPAPLGLFFRSKQHRPCPGFQLQGCFEDEGKPRGRMWGHFEPGPRAQCSGRGRG